MQVPETERILAGLNNHLAGVDPSLRSRFPVSRYIAALDRQPEQRKYRDLPLEATSFCNQIAEQFSVTVLETYQKSAMATLISDFDRRVRTRRFPHVAIEMYKIEFARILGEFNTNSPGFYSLDNDLFLKDLGLCRTVLIPGGVEFVQESSGVPRGLLWRGGARQCFEACYLFCVGLRGFKPFYEIHMDSRRRSVFSPETRAFCYRLVAELLLLNPEVKGMIGGSWFYDPVLEDISPHLAYLRKVPLQNGAKVFFYRAEGTDSGALVFSGNRRKLHALGRYQPKSYILVWPRERLIRWARGFGDLRVDDSPGLGMNVI